MMRAYTTLLVQTCHRRGAFAMGGMAAQIPIKNDPAANDAALAKVRADKLREVRDGHDGTWVAHPALVPIAREVFDQHMPGPNQLQVLRPDVATSAADLLAVPSGERTLEGLRQNIRVGIRYLAAWLTGQGCVPLFNLMEDAATAEISRSQVWQWIRHQADVGGAPLDAARVRSVVVEEMSALRDELGDDAFRRGRFDEARALFESMATRDTLDDFLTLEAYPLLREPVPES